MSSEQRTVFITGGGGGLGSAVARRLTLRGWGVVAAGRRVGLLEKLAAELSTIRVCALDVADAQAVETVIRVHAPDALVCCAAIMGRGAIWDELTPERFARVIAINVGGTFHACRAAMNFWRERGTGGDIVNVSSLGGLRGMQRFSGFGAYATSKHAVCGMTEALALEGKPYDIRVNGIAPGAMRTEMIIALGLVPKTTPDAVAPTVEYLLDRTLSAPVTGTIVDIHCNDD